MEMLTYRHNTDIQTHRHSDKNADFLKLIIFPRLPDFQYINIYFSFIGEVAFEANKLFLIITDNLSNSDNLVLAPSWEKLLPRERKSSARPENSSFNLQYIFKTSIINIIAFQIWKNAVLLSVVSLPFLPGGAGGGWEPLGVDGHPVRVARPLLRSFRIPSLPCACGRRSWRSETSLIRAAAAAGLLVVKLCRLFFAFLHHMSRPPFVIGHCHSRHSSLDFLLPFFGCAFDLNLLLEWRVFGVDWKDSCLAGGL